MQDLARRVLRFGGITNMLAASKEFAEIVELIAKEHLDPKTHVFTRFMVLRMRALTYSDCGDVYTTEQRVRELAKLNEET